MAARRSPWCRLCVPYAECGSPGVAAVLPGPAAVVLCFALVLTSSLPCLVHLMYDCRTLSFLPVAVLFLAFALSCRAHAQLGPAVGGYVLATLLTGKLADRAAKRHGDTVSTLASLDESRAIKHGTHAALLRSHAMCSVAECHTAEVYPRRVA